MPAYDYRCKACQHVFEKRHSMSFEGEVLCPNCQSADTSKIISAPYSICDWFDSDSVHDSTRRRGAVRNPILREA